MRLAFQLGLPMLAIATFLYSAPFSIPPLDRAYSIIFYTLSHGSFRPVLDHAFDPDSVVVQEHSDG